MRSTFVKGKVGLAALCGLLVGVAGGWLAGEAVTSHQYNNLLLNGIHVDAANKIAFDLNLIQQAKTQGCQRVVSTLEQYAEFAVSELADYGSRPFGASQEMV